jgi:hypothetical protein
MSKKGKKKKKKKKKKRKTHFAIIIILLFTLISVYYFNLDIGYGTAATPPWRPTITDPFLTLIRALGSSPYLS